MTSVSAPHTRIAYAAIVLVTRSISDWLAEPSAATTSVLPASTHPIPHTVGLLPSAAHTAISHRIPCLLPPPAWACFAHMFARTNPDSVNAASPAVYHSIAVPPAVAVT